MKPSWVRYSKWLPTVAHTDCGKFELDTDMTFLERSLREMGVPYIRHFRTTREGLRFAIFAERKALEARGIAIGREADDEERPGAK
jgi:hypothetical protein